VGPTLVIAQFDVKSRRVIAMILLIAFIELAQT
jgi:hypothetical protein